MAKKARQDFIDFIQDFTPEMLKDAYEGLQVAFICEDGKITGAFQED